MAKQDKPKVNRGERNSTRNNGKANKKGTVKHRKNKQDPIQRILLGDGAYVNVKKRWAANA
jgi:hypothetical protein